MQPKSEFNMKEVNNTTEVNNKNQIDLLSIAKVLWKAKKLYALTCGIAIIIGIIVAFSIPKTYKAKVVLAPELTSGMNLSGGLSDIASMMGVNIGNNGSSFDAIYPELYPEIVNSVPFLTDLFNIKINTKDGSLKDITLYTYLKSKQKAPWWATLIGGIKNVFSKNNGNITTDNKINNFMLTPEQDDIAQAIQGMINCSVDKKTSIITISVTTQDALVSASLADIVCNKIQDYIIAYRTKKARNDLDYVQKLCTEAKAQYVKAQEKYSSFSDSNEDLILQSYKAKQEEMENEMQLRYNIYNQCAQQLQMAKAKVQERTPAFTVIEPATVPLKKDGPKRMTILFVYVFIAIVLTSIYALYKDASKKG